jgi:enamine deaminase RidA (YjgF/YER057c/UK114 family)
MGLKAFGVDASFGYSQAVRLGDLLFLAGQVEWDEKGHVVGGADARLQTEQAFSNLRAVLEAAGSSLDRVAKLTIFATSRDHLAAIREVRHKVFDPIGHYPASTFIVVSGLASPELLVEIEAVATATRP